MQDENAPKKCKLEPEREKLSGSLEVKVEMRRPSTNSAGKVKGIRLTILPKSYRSNFSLVRSKRQLETFWPIRCIVYGMANLWSIAYDFDQVYL